MENIHQLSSELVNLAKTNASCTETWDAKYTEFQQLAQQLIGADSSLEVKQKFHLVAIELAECGSQVGQIRTQLRARSSSLIELVKEAGVTSYLTPDGVEFVMEPSIRVKLPSVDDVNAEVIDQNDDDGGVVESKGSS